MNKYIVVALIVAPLIITGQSLIEIIYLYPEFASNTIMERDKALVKMFNYLNSPASVFGIYIWSWAICELINKFTFIIMPNSILRTLYFTAFVIFIIICLPIIITMVK